MPALTPANRDHARRALIASGYPIGDDVDHLERLRRTELLDAIATVDQLAEARGFTAAFTAVEEVTDPEDPAYQAVVAAARSAGVDLRPDSDPGGLLDTDEPQPDEPLCPHPHGHPEDPASGWKMCPDCGDVEVRPAATHAGRYDAEDLEDQAADAARARRADRMSWSPGDLQITPPPDGPR